MRKEKPVSIRIGGSHQMSEIAPGMLFESSELGGQWSILGDGNSYILCRDDGRYVRFLEFRAGDDNITIYKAREWQRRSKDDNCYTLGKPHRSYNLRMPTKFSQELRNAARQKEAGACRLFGMV